MSNEPLDVLIAVYLIPDLAQRDFDAMVRLIEDNAVAINGVVLVNKNTDGEVDVSEAGGDTGRLPKPARKVVRHLVANKIGKELDDQLPAGSAGVVAVYDHARADTVRQTLANSIRMSTSKIDKIGAKELKEGLAAAGAGLAG